MKTQAVCHRWRDYSTATGGRPVKDLMDKLLKDKLDGKNEDYTSVTAAMMDVARHGMDVARHVRGDIYEVRASGKDVIYRVLFAQEGQLPLHQIIRPYRYPLITLALAAACSAGAAYVLALSSPRR